MSEINRRVVIAANSSWNIVNFRGGLVQALKVADFEPIVVAPIDPASAARMSLLGVEHVPIEINRSGMNPAADIQLILNYRAILRKIRPAAFLSFTIKPNLYGSLAARMTGVPAISNISGLGTTFAKQGVLRQTVSLLYRFSLASNVVVFFQNIDDQTLFLDSSLVRFDQARLLPGSGIDLEHYSVQAQPQGPVTFLLVARLLADKGVRLYVEAARRLRLEFPDAKFQLLGPLDAENPTAISAVELESWIREGAIDYLGYVDDVRPYIAAATTVVLPSFYREGVPHILLEAAAMGRPVVTTDATGCREAVSDQVTGRLCEPRSIDSLVEAMRWIAMLSFSERQLMGQAARQKMEQEYKEEIVHRAYLDALLPLIER